ncbi:hypothetical protein [Moraxella nasicaprae]|uniref:Uncharacterized protein n=1 Tax=Moraxella nasicaprae TaxID=2904122 RepID=A0ABY6F5B2_9GAMM|nr:hypothetical protein [Moraxella nasicaprae]UXZ05272.1 hypothetical protein LU297_02125 [Moraxella nasicaprae]
MMTIHFLTCPSEHQLWVIYLVVHALNGLLTAFIIGQSGGCSAVSY